MDMMTFATIVAAIMPVCVAATGYLFHRLRNADWDKIKAMKDDSDAKIEFMEKRIEALSDRIADVYTNVQAKLDKSEHQVALARIDREISDLRNDQKQGQAEIRQDIKDLRQDLMAAIRDNKK